MSLLQGIRCPCKDKILSGLADRRRYGTALFCRYPSVPPECVQTGAAPRSARCPISVLIIPGWGGVCNRLSCRIQADFDGIFPADDTLDGGGLCRFAGFCGARSMGTAGSIRRMGLLHRDTKNSEGGTQGTFLGIFVRRCLPGGRAPSQQRAFRGQTIVGTSGIMAAFSVSRRTAGRYR